MTSLLAAGPLSAATIGVPADAATIQAGIDLARPGDVVLVAPGTYLGSATIHVNKAITLASQYHTTGLESYIDQTIIDSTAATTLDVTAAGAGALITGFTFKASAKGIQLMAKADVVHCAFLDTGGDSLSWEDGGAGRFAHNRFANCGDDCIDSDDDSNGIAGGDRIIEHNTMNGAGDDCIEIRLQSYTGTEMQYFVRNNRMENCTDDGLQLIDYPGLSSRRFFVYRNLFRTSGTSGVGATADGVTDQTGSGSPMVEPVQIFNNTIIGPKWGIVGGTNMLVVNNIIKGTSLYALRMLQGQSWAAYNDLFQNAAEADTSSQPLVGEGTLRVDPLLDSSYRLTSGSPCIDAGIAHYEKNGQVLDVTDAIGGAPDIGSDEYGGGGPATNRPPSVNAGPDRQTFHPTATILLDGTVTDDGKPGTGIDITWSKMEGPGTVTFSNAKAADTNVTFEKQGTYKLKIDASDGELASSDSVIVKYVQDGSGAKIDIAAPGTTYFEAEAFSWLYAPAGGVADAAASGGRAILVPEGRGAEGRSEYTLALRQGGYSYYVWVRMAGPDTAGDTVAVSFNGSAERVLTTTADGAYHWQKMDASFPSPAGEYPFIVRAAEDGVRWDRIAFTTDAGFVPDDTPITRVDVRVAAGSDDAEESSTGSVSLGSSDLELVTDASVQTIGIRFPGLAIPPGAVIRSAAVQFQVDEATADATTLTIQAQADDDASTFTTTSADISSRPRTTARVSWIPPAWTTVGAAGVEQRTADLAVVIQEIVNRPGWRSGNAIALIITGTGKRVAAAYEVSAAAAPILNLEYTLRAADTEAPAAPTGLQSAATQEGGVIQLNWNANGESDLAGYRLLYGTASGLHTSTLSVGKVTSHTLRGLDPGSTYYFVLKAFDFSGNLSDPSTEVSARPKAVVGSPPVITSAIEVATGSVFVLQPGRHGVRVDGSSFQTGAIVSLGSDITAGPASLSGSTRLALTIDVGSAAALGPRAVTVTNPDTGEGVRQGALRVVRTPDIDRSCKIDGVDLNLMARSWNTRNIDTAYCAACDLDGLNGVDGDDLAIFIEYFAQRLAVCP